MTQFEDIFPLQNPPNFLRASALSEHISPVVVIPAEASSPDSEPILEKDDLMDMDASQQVKTTWERILALPVAPRYRGEDRRGPGQASLILTRFNHLPTQPLT